MYLGRYLCKQKSDYLTCTNVYIKFRRLNREELLDFTEGKYRGSCGRLNNGPKDAKVLILGICESVVLAAKETVRV